MELRERFGEWVTRLDALSRREKGFIGFAGGALVITTLQALWLDPLLETAERADQQAGAQRRVNATLTQTLAAGKLSAAERELEALTTDVATLQQTLDAMDDDIGKYADTLVAPHDMANLLGSVLAERGLRLTAMQNEPAEPILEFTNDVTAEGQNKGQVNLYKHALTLELEGGFHDTVDYLERLEALPWRFVWDDLDYEVTGYPQAAVRLKVHTLSTETYWFEA